MKKLKFIALILVASVIAITSCKKDDPEGPTISVTPASATAWKGDTVTFNYTVSSNVELETLTATPDNNIISAQTVTLSDFSKTGTIEFILPSSSLNDGDVINVAFKAIDKDGEEYAATASAAINVTEPAPTTTDLGTAVAVTWERCGSTNATGLSTYGLAWTSSSKAINANITKSGATKFVELTAAQWTSITTVEDLTTAVDGGTDLTTWSSVPADGSGSTLDHVLGVKNGSTYYMIHLTNVAFVGGGCTANGGNLVTITGQAKN